MAKMCVNIDQERCLYRLGGGICKATGKSECFIGRRGPRINTETSATLQLMWRVFENQKQIMERLDQIEKRMNVDDKFSDAEYAKIRQIITENTRLRG